MAYTIALNFEDGVSRFIECNENEKVLDAAYRQQVNLPMDCSDGVCGTCKCHCESGRYDLGDEYLEEALSEQEFEDGQVLTCQMIPNSDCVISVPLSSQMCKTGSETYTAQVVRAESLSDSAIELNLELTSHLGVPFLSGQYVNIQLPNSQDTRAYSFSSMPGEKTLSFLIRNVPNGRMSQYLTTQAKPGDVLNLIGPQGSFYLREVTRPILMLAGGTGLAPFLSMLHQLQGSGLKHQVHLIYGVSRDVDTVKLAQLEAFAAQIPQFSFSVCVTDPASSAELKGYVTDHIEPGQINDGEVDIYLCGPPPMVEAVITFLKSKSITPRNFYYEKFAPQVSKETA
ncbi:ring-hydroxylating dioxygenase ferredoxin reductase family protein [Rouxiella badensis]|uniref:benzoate 1,2-dioxygenase electron transfer component BenC n=1 Tax=Rouxiella badensis TaxID=1646377 RepID=UPI0013EF1321|nr:benzoate 1,2-dioxygenase electron transfer component BenC [Rouxiella badensis]MCC3718085.1 ring-hydroxylating dioxygenase ferredoxin reductase family protein [Rouxiella badensis]MCC3727147.1 ring-hydroxylating dioxygenase ferredoxin reductase family protein [Rouxiella badensis]MCC3731569.1 ring-hydroxylating dioxygenase ferredoxin reductase family protein [Rouxiella badensis]MCC3738504.1 ring-hydroxylating dioxygenase ferredoxin reductase family protein [Rouxiella badensis]MCC3756958.1 ring